MPVPLEQSPSTSDSPSLHRSSTDSPFGGNPNAASSTGNSTAAYGQSQSVGADGGYAGSDQPSYAGGRSDEVFGGQARGNATATQGTGAESGYAAHYFIFSFDGLTLDVSPQLDRRQRFGFYHSHAVTGDLLREVGRPPGRLRRWRCCPRSGST